MTDILFSPLNCGAIELPNRVLMAPLTRNRSQADGTPTDMAATYYRQRASAGLIVSEATQVSAMGKGYKDTPGIYTDAHVEGWKPIVEAVHAGGGRIFCQLWHVGRISHVSLLPDGAQPVSSSAVRAETQTFTENGFEDTFRSRSRSTPTASPARSTICQRRAPRQGSRVRRGRGARRERLSAGPVPAGRRQPARGRIRRLDREPDLRLLGEVFDRVCAVFPADRVGVRFSPLGQANDISDSEPEAIFSAAYAWLSERGLAYLHAVEQFFGQDSSEEDAALLKRLRGKFGGVYIGNGSYDAESAPDAVDRGQPGRCDHIWPPLHREPRPARTHAHRRRDERAGSGHVLWRRGRGLHRLPVPRPAALTPAEPISGRTGCRGSRTPSSRSRCRWGRGRTSWPARPADP